MIFLAIGFLVFSGSFATLFWLLGLIHCGLSFWLFKDIRNDKICAQMMLTALKDGGK